MITLLDFYDFAEQQGVDVDWLPMAQSVSLSMPLADGTYGIAIDPWKVDTLEQETVLLAHELGHCMTGAFYNRWATRDVRKKHENTADKWAVKKFISAEQLDAAVADGHTEMWDLAEHFNVTLEFMQKIVCWYTYGNMSSELYF